MPRQVFNEHLSDRYNYQSDYKQHKLNLVSVDRNEAFANMNKHITRTRTIPTLGVLGNLTVLCTTNACLKEIEITNNLKMWSILTKKENQHDLNSPYLQPSPTLPRETGILTGQVSREFDVISKPKNVCLATETNKYLSTFLINYHPSAMKLSISASGQRQSRLKNVRLTFFTFSYFCFQNALE